MGRTSRWLWWLALALGPTSARAVDFEDIPAPAGLILSQKATQVEPIGRQFWSGKYPNDIQVMVEITQRDPSEWLGKPSINYTVWVHARNAGSVPVRIKNDSIRVTVDALQKHCAPTQVNQLNARNESVLLQPGDETGWTGIVLQFDKLCNDEHKGSEPDVYTLVYNSAIDDRINQWAAVRAQIVQMMNAGDLDGAKRLLDESTNLNTDYRDGNELWHKLRGLMDDRGRAQAAAAQKQAQLKALIDKGNAALGRDDLEGARAHFAEAETLEPGSTGGKIGEIDRAIAEHKARKEEEARLKTLAQRAESSMNSGDLEGARAILGEIRGIRSDYGALSSLQSRLARLEKEREDARIAAEAAEAEAKADRAAAAEARAQAQTAQAAEQAVAPKPGPQNAAAQQAPEWIATYNQGVLAMRADDYQGAADKFALAIEQGADDPRVRQALANAQNAMRQQEAQVEAAQQAAAQRAAWEEEHQRRQAEAAARAQVQRERAEAQAAAYQARIERQQALVDEGSALLEKRLDRYVANQGLRDLVRESSNLDLSISDPEGLLRDYETKVENLRQVAAQRHEEFQEEMQELIEWAAKMLAEAEASAGASGAAAVLAGVAAAGGHAAIEAEKAKKEKQLREQLHTAFDDARNDLVSENQNALGQYGTAAARALVLEQQDYYDAFAEYHQCNIDKIRQRFSYDNTSWTETGCRQPSDSKPTVRVESTTSAQRVELARVKIERARGSNSKDWLESAALLADGAVAKNPKNPDAWALKAKLTKDPIDRLAWLLRAVAQPGGKAYESEKDDAIPTFSKRFMEAVASAETDFLDRSARAGLHTLARSEDGEAPLVAAIRHEQPDSLEALLRIFEVETATDGAPLLHLAASTDSGACTARLVELGVPAQAPDEEGRSALYLAVAAGADASAEILAARGPNWVGLVKLASDRDEPGVADDLGRMAMDRAIEADDLPAARALLATRPSLVQVDRTERDTFTSWSAARGSVPWLTLFLDQGASADATDLEGAPVLLLALAEAHDPAVELLLERGADPTRARAATGETALHHAVRLEDPRWLEHFLDAGTPLDAQDSSGRTAIHLATERGEPDWIDTVLERGPNLGLQDSDGNTPLHLALAKPDEAIARTLLPTSYDLDLQNSKHQAPIHLAVAAGLEALVDELVANGASVDLQDHEGNTPLHTAIRMENAEQANKLLDAGAEINRPNASGHMALHLASRVGSVQLVSRLLDQGAYVNHADDNGSTPLHFGAASGNPEVVQHLLERGADKHLRNQSKRTPARVARKRDDSEIAKLIARWEESPNPAVRTAGVATRTVSTGLEGSGLLARSNGAEPVEHQFQVVQKTAWELDLERIDERSETARDQARQVREERAACPESKRDDPCVVNARAQLALLRQQATPRRPGLETLDRPGVVAEDLAALEARDYHRAAELASEPAYRTYLERWPDGNSAAAARSELEALHADEHEVRFGVQFLRTRTNERTRFYGIALPFLKGPGSYEHFSGLDLGLIGGGGAMATFGEPVVGELNGASIGLYTGAQRLNGLAFGLGSEIEHLRGLQLGAVNDADRAVGTQVGGANLSHDVRGVQLGLFNRADQVRGVQIGAMNMARSLHGVQIGLVCHAPDAILPWSVGLNAGFRRRQ